MQNTALSKVLLADDDEINRLIILRILTEDRGYDVSVAVDGREALMACLTNKFDLLIIDYKMPGIPGDRLIRNLRASQNPNKDTQIILFSAATREELTEVLATCKIDLLVSKPISAAGFLGDIEALLGAGQ